MKKVSNIMYLVSMILGIVLAVTLFICAVATIAISFIPPIQDAIKEGLQNIPEEDREIVFNIIIGSNIAAGVLLILVAICSAASAILCGIARNKNVKALHIVNIVIGAIGGNDLAIAAAILGLIADNKEKKKEATGAKEIE